MNRKEQRLQKLSHISNLISDKGVQAIQWKQESLFNKWCWNRRTSTGKMNPASKKTHRWQICTGRCPASHVTREMQIKTARRHHSLLNEWTKLGTLTTPNSVKDMEQ